MNVQAAIALSGVLLALITGLLGVVYKLGQTAKQVEVNREGIRDGRDTLRLIFAKFDTTNEKLDRALGELAEVRRHVNDKDKGGC